MVTGGMFLVPVENEERGKHGIPSQGLALRVKHLGQYAPHDAAKKAGFQKDDVVVAYDGRSDLLTDSDVLRLGVTQHKPGDEIQLEVIRGGARRSLKLTMQP